MIYFFSGTGNSRYVAEIAAGKLNDLCCDIVSPQPFCGETLGLVFPVYAWGLPFVVEEFIENQLENLLSSKKVTYVFCIMTHGDDMGYADNILRKKLATVNLPLSAVFSVFMPNTYVCLPGFDVDKDEVADGKVSKTVEKLKSICQQIENKEERVDVNRGALPYTKTYILRPLFNKFLVTDKYFHTSDSCTLCGACASQCPLKNIEVSDKVRWKGNCTGCLRCYHKCPNSAIKFGKFTEGKGQKKSLKSIVE